jgi:nucleoside-diphosphate-sugar epimerase
MASLANKTALVTGASRGIGRATAEALATVGAHVIVHYGRAAAEAHALVETRLVTEASLGIGRATAGQSSRPVSVLARRPWMLCESFKQAARFAWRSHA